MVNFIIVTIIIDFISFNQKLSQKLLIIEIQ